MRLVQRGVPLVEAERQQGRVEGNLPFWRRCLKVLVLRFDEGVHIPGAALGVPDVAQVQLRREAGELTLPIIEQAVPMIWSAASCVTATTTGSVRSCMSKVSLIIHLE